MILCPTGNPRFQEGKTICKKNTLGKVQKSESEKWNTKKTLLSICLGTESIAVDSLNISGM